MTKDEWVETRANEALTEMEISPQKAARHHAECLAAEVLRLRRKLVEQEKLALGAVKIVQAAAFKRIDEVRKESVETHELDFCFCGVTVGFEGERTLLCAKPVGHEGDHGK